LDISTITQDLSPGFFSNLEKVGEFHFHKHLDHQWLVAISLNKAVLNFGEFPSFGPSSHFFGVVVEAQNTRDFNCYPYVCKSVYHAINGVSNFHFVVFYIYRNRHVGSVSLSKATSPFLAVRFRSDILSVFEAVGLLLLWFPQTKMVSPQLPMCIQRD
jgi:hypothetical protein